MTSILVHAAWAGASNWNKVLLPLGAAGLKAVAAQLPLTSLSADVATRRQVMAATQKPTSLKCITKPMTAPAWTQKPSWYLLAEGNRVIAPATQAFMAQRARALIKSGDVDHSPTTSAPQTVANLIREAVNACL